MLEVLGRGGFGKVVRARFDGPRGFSRQVAIKLLLPSSNTERNAEALRRLRDEARLLGLLQHRALVAVDRLAVIDGEWSVVMEYVVGVDGDRLLSAGPLPVRPAFEIVHEIADVLDHAWQVPGPEGHPLRMLHRDIKPANFLLTADGLVKVLDLGIARAQFAARESLTEDVSFGTPSYMAPERLRGVEVHEGDVYSLGCVLYALLQGQPFGRAGLSLRAHTLHRDERLDDLRTARPDLSDEVLELLAELLAFEPEARPTAVTLAARCLALAETMPPPSLRAWSREVVPRLRAERKPGPSPEVGSVLVEESEGAVEVSSGAVVPAGTAGSTSSPPSAALASAPPGPPPSIVVQALPVTASGPGPRTVGADGVIPWTAVVAGMVGVFALAAVAWIAFGWLRPEEETSHAGSVTARELSAAQTREPTAAREADGPTDVGVGEVGVSDEQADAASSQASGETEDRARARPTPTGSAPDRTEGRPANTDAATPRSAPPANVLVKGGVPLVLEQQGRELRAPGTVPPGKYRILATFDGSSEPAGSVTVPVSGRVTITCDPKTYLCASVAEP